MQRWKRRQTNDTLSCCYPHWRFHPQLLLLSVLLPFCSLLCRKTEPDIIVLSHTHNTWVSFFLFCSFILRNGSVKNWNFMFQFTFPSFFSLTHLCFWVKFWGRGESRGEGGRDDDDDGRSSINSIVAMWLYLRTLHSTSTLYLLWPLWHWYMCMFSFFISRHKW